MQPAHALAQFAIQHQKVFKEWQHNHKNLIVLAVESEDALHQLLTRAQSQQVKVSAFREPDIGNELTAIALEPCEKTYSLTGHLKLALRETG